MFPDFKGFFLYIVKHICLNIDQSVSPSVEICNPFLNRPRVPGLFEFTKTITKFILNPFP